LCRMGLIAMDPSAVHLALTEHGEALAHEYLLRDIQGTESHWAPLRIEPPLVIQPTLELLTPMYQNPHRLLRLAQVADVETMDAAHALEIYNGASELAYEMGHSGHILDVLIARGRRMDACATDDAHFEYPDYPDHGLGWVEVRAEENDPDALVEALKAGHFYATEGPELLDVSIDGNELLVVSSPVMKVIVSGGGERYECRYGLELTRTRVPLTMFQNGAFEADPLLGTYIRVTVVDAQGKRAWTNPIWLG
jgi:hypothetical protein